MFNIHFTVSRSENHRIKLRVNFSTAVKKKICTEKTTTLCQICTDNSKQILARQQSSKSQTVQVFKHEPETKLMPHC